MVRLIPILVVLALCGCHSGMRSIIGTRTSAVTIDVRRNGAEPVTDALVRIRPMYATVPGSLRPIALKPRSGQSGQTDADGRLELELPVDVPLQITVVAADGEVGSLDAPHPGLGETGWTTMTQADGSPSSLEIRLQ